MHSLGIKTYVCFRCKMEHHVATSHRFTKGIDTGQVTYANKQPPMSRMQDSAGARAGTLHRRGS
jgi:hypothetical protein